MLFQWKTESERVKEKNLCHSFRFLRFRFSSLLECVCVSLVAFVLILLTKGDRLVGEALLSSLRG